MFDNFNPFMDDSDLNDEFYFTDSFGSQQNRYKKVDPYGFKPRVQPVQDFDPFAQQDFDPFGSGQGTTPQQLPLDVKTTAGEEAAMKAVGDTRSPDFDFWRDNDSYKKWLQTKNINPQALAGWQGAKLFTNYIQDKAENPTGVAWLSDELGKAVGRLGSVASAIAEEVGQVPVIGDLAKPVGSVLRFISNAVDVFRAVPAAIFSDLVSGHPEEMPDSIWAALKHSFTSGTEGRYVSWADGALRILTDQYQKGSTPEEFKNYINSDQYRATKRKWQMGGLVLDLVLDPMWVTSMGATRGAATLKSLEYAKAGAAKVVGSSSMIADIEKQVHLFASKTFDWLDFMKKSKDFDQLGISTGTFKRAYSLTKGVMNDLMHGVKYSDDVAAMGRYTDLSELVTEMISDYHKTLLESPKIYDKYLGSGLKIWKPFTKRSSMIAEMPIPIHRMTSKLMELIGREPSSMSKYLFSRNLEKDLTRTALDTARSVRDAGIASDKNRVSLFSGIDESLREVERVLREKGMNPTKEDVFEVFHDAMQYKAETSLKIPESAGEIIGQKFKVGEVNQDGLVDAWSFSKKFMSVKPELMTKQAIIDTRKLWDETTTFALNVDKKTAQGIIDEYIRVGAAREVKGGKIEMLTTGHDARAFNILSLIPQEWQNRFFNYVTARTDPEFIELARKAKGVSELPQSERVAMLQNYHRLNYMIDDIMDPGTLSKLFGEEDALQKLDMVRNANMTVEDLWFAAHDKMRSKFLDPKYADDISELLSTEKIKWQSPLVINTLAENGLFIKGVKHRVFDINPSGMIDRLDRTYETLGRLDAFTGINRVAEDMGFFKRYKKVGEAVTEKPPLYLGKYDWVQGSGLFSNYWVPEMISKQTKALSEGISRVYNPIEKEIYGGIAKIPMLKMIKHYNDWWRPQVTLKNIAFHSRNFITNTLMTFSEGRLNIFDDAARDSLDLWRYGHYRAKQIEDPLAFRKSGMEDKLNKLKERKIVIGSQAYPMEEAFFKLTEHGVVGNAQVHEILWEAHVESGMMKRSGGTDVLAGIDSLYKKGFGQKMNIFGTNDYITIAGGHLSSLIEEGFARIPLFLHHTRKNGMSMMEAGRRVNDIFVDYGSLTKGQKIVKQYAIPFFTWQYKMIGVMLKKAMTNPTMFSKVAQFQGNLSRMLETDRMLESQMEEEAEGMPIITPDQWGKFFFEGKPMSEIKTKFIALERFIPQAVVNLVDARTPIDLINPANYINGISKKIIENLAPMPKFIFFESPMDLNIQTRNPFERFLGERVELWGIPMTKKWKQFLTSLGAWVRTADDAIKLFNEDSYTGDKMEPIDFFLKHVAGMKAYEKDEIRELEKLIRVINDGYRGNMRSAKLKKHNPEAVKFHYENALSMKFALDLLDFYKKYTIEMKDKERYDEMQEEERIKLLKKRYKKKKRSFPF